MFDFSFKKWRVYSKRNLSQGIVADNYAKNNEKFTPINTQDQV